MHQIPSINSCLFTSYFLIIYTTTKTCYKLIIKCSLSGSGNSRFVVANCYILFLLSVKGFGLEKYLNYIPASKNMIFGKAHHPICSQSLLQVAYLSAYFVHYIQTASSRPLCRETFNCVFQCKPQDKKFIMLL